MRYLWGLILAGGVILGHSNTAEAQFSLSIGNPYGGGLYVGNPYSYGYGSNYVYGSGVYGAPALVAPGLGYGGYPVRSYGYSSGYRGYRPGPVYGGYGRGYGGYGRGYGGFGRGFGGFRR